MTIIKSFHIPFNKPYMTGKELDYIKEAHLLGVLAGDGSFTKKCHHWLEDYAKNIKALLTHSCTAALEMSAFLLDIKPGDEIIMPSYTFVSTANAFVLRGGIPVFVDIRSDTQNLDEKLIAEAVTSKTKAIAVVHYAGVSCEMDAIMDIGDKYNLHVVEDAAQGICASYKNKPLGAIGDLGTLSFHETKNIISGEGGALLINSPQFIERAEIIREKGTDRSKFFRGEVDKYTWKDLGSSFLPGDITAAFLYAQLEEAQEITRRRRVIWDFYHEQLEVNEKNGSIIRPVVPKNCTSNAHIYYIILRDSTCRAQILAEMKSRGVNAISHYVPLHSSPAGEHYGRTSGSLSVTTQNANSIIRLPLWVGMSEGEMAYVVEVLQSTIKKYC